MFNSDQSLPQTSDYVGIFSAVICMIHCLAAPILMGASAHLHEHAPLWLAEEWNFLFLAIGFFAVWYSSRHTHSNFLKISLWITYGILALALSLETYAESLHYLVYVASGALIIAHIINLRKRINLSPQRS